MPTPPENLTPIAERFRPMLDRLRDEGQVVADLTIDKRYRNKADLQRIRKSGKCLFPGCKEWKTGEVDPHHVLSKGAGGSDREAGPKGSGQKGNTVGLCRTHHTMAHDGTLPHGFFEWFLEVEGAA